MAAFRYVVCDVFTDTPLQGNQLAVFTDARDLDAETMLALTREMNYSESVFVVPSEADADVRIRIFTPAQEIAFAGHPTLGSAFVLGGPLQKTTIRLETGVGVVPVELEREGPRIVFGRMQQPIPTVEAYGSEHELLDALGVSASRLPVELYDNGSRHVYVCLGSEDEVARLDPDFRRLAKLDAILGVNCFAGDGQRGAARRARRSSRPRPVRRGDRDLAGRRARPSVEALRARRGLRRAAGPRRGRRLGRRRRARRVPPALAATSSPRARSAGSSPRASSAP